ncbi:hypothetical protein P7K49_004333 [Saguinus oedipus]|uniref:Uncharacterized protein n=1 Tax=Saguinus oedipus TaxID=9490 RepID=A0ABQ9W734_SAGOE|nr:hypothetical protein P7K49_004333 [Saguinus oedipus]
MCICDERNCTACKPGERDRFRRGVTPGDRDRFRRGVTPGDRDRFRRGVTPGDRDRFRRGVTPGDRDRFRRGDSADGKAGMLVQPISSCRQSHVHRPLPHLQPTDEGIAQVTLRLGRGKPIV